MKLKVSKSKNTSSYAQNLTIWFRVAIDRISLDTIILQNKSKQF